MLHQLLHNAKGIGKENPDLSMLCHKLSKTHQMAMLEPVTNNKIDKGYENILPQLLYLGAYSFTSRLKKQVQNYLHEMIMTVLLRTHTFPNAIYVCVLFLQHNEAILTLEQNWPLQTPNHQSH